MSTAFNSKNPFKSNLAYIFLSVRVEFKKLTISVDPVSKYRGESISNKSSTKVAASYGVGAASYSGVILWRGISWRWRRGAGKIAPRSSECV